MRGLTFGTCAGEVRGRGRAGDAEVWPRLPRGLREEVAADEERLPHLQGPRPGGREVAEGRRVGPIQFIPCN